jgi:2-polyprenyl-6-methoxyphenol hydroxylase-like FAD-dependent oxidoreductase
MPRMTTRCCIAGGGPAGMMAGLLLARAGVDTVVLEKHGDFLRDFRGDTVHPSTLELMYELGVLDAFLARPHQQVHEIGGDIDGQRVTVADFTHLPTHCKFVALMPQWDFLDFLADEGRRYPTFHLVMNGEVVDLLRTGGQVTGVHARTAHGDLEIDAALTIGADGRHSIVRERAGLDIETLGAPIDVLWLRLSRRDVVSGSRRPSDDVVSGFRGTSDDVVSGFSGTSDDVVSGFSGTSDDVVSGFSGTSDDVVSGCSRTADDVVSGFSRTGGDSSDPSQTLGIVRAGRIFVMLNRGDYWQCAFVIPKGGYEMLRARGLESFRADIASIVPFLADRVGELRTWDDVKLLTVMVDRLRQWYMPGLLCIGDAAHAMSPIGGVGINLAVQDAVAAANLLHRPLREGTVSVADLAAVQRRRLLPTRVTQAAQVAIQKNVLAQVLDWDRGASIPLPFPVRMLRRYPFLRRIPARLVGIGVRPEHVRTPDAFGSTGSGGYN